MGKMSGWQKAGLIAGVGCCSIIAMLVVAVVVAVAWARSTLAEFGDTNPTRVERSVTLSDTSARPEPGRGGRAASGQNVAPSSAEPLQLEIDLEEGNFVIRPGPQDSQVRVEGTFSQNLYELTETHDPSEAGRASHTRIRFRSKAPAWARMLAGMGEGAGRPTINVMIPEGVPMDLSLRVGLGESSIDLGGLSLRELTLDASMGNHRVDFRQPLASELDRVNLVARMGNISIGNLGNVRAKSIDAAGSMGNLIVDMGGDWKPGTESDVSVSHSMGELTVRVPRGIRLQTSGTAPGDNQGRPDAADETKADAPTLRLRLNTSMGDSRISRY